MSRKKKMPCRDEITVSAKVKIEVHDALKEVAIEEGCGMNTLLKRMVINELYERGYNFELKTNTERENERK